MQDALAIRPCGIEQLDAVLAIEQEAIAVLARPDLLRRNTQDMWRCCLQPPHICLGSWVGEELVGFAVLYVPQPGDGEDLSCLLTKVNGTAYKSANFKICIVRPRWRGRGLQVLLGARLHKEAVARGINLLCSTASPYNEPSVCSLRKLGYQPDHLLTKYGFERMLFYHLIKFEHEFQQA